MLLFLTYECCLRLVIKRGVLCRARDLGEPRDAPALFAGESIARLARFLIITACGVTVYYSKPF